MNRSRHSGHHDRSPAEVAEAVRRTSDAHPVPLGVDDPVSVDTAEPVDIDAVLDACSPSWVVSRPRGHRRPSGACRRLWLDA